MKTSENPEVIVVGGIGSKVTNLLPLVSLGEHLGNGAFQSVHGAHIQNGSLVASLPSYQTKELHNIIKRSMNRKFLIIAHSLGALAALNIVEQYPDRAQALAIAPPLPDPLRLHCHAHIQARIQQRGGQLYMPSYSFASGDNGPRFAPLPTPVDILVPSSYAADVQLNAIDFVQRAVTASKNKQLRVIVPCSDWNTELVAVAPAITDPIYVEGDHSLQGSPEEIAHRTAYIAQRLQGFTPRP